MPLSSARTLVVTGVALLALVAAVVGPRLAGDGDSRFAGLVEAVGAERYVDGRFSGGFRYGPRRSLARQPGEAAGTTNLALLAAAADLQREVRDLPSPDALHAWGVAQVLLGDHDAGVRTLEDALAARPDDPRLMSDLATALLARGDALTSVEDWPEAVSLASRALDRLPALREAAFTRAAALERMGLLHETDAAWRLALDGAPADGWEALARERLEDVAARLADTRDLVRFPDIDAPRDDLERLAASDPQRAREFAEGPLLAAWSGAALAGRTARAHSLLASARVVALALAPTGSRALLDAVEHLDAATGPRRLALARAWGTFAEGLAVYEGDQPGASLERFVEAYRVFAREGSPYRHWARLHEIAARYSLGQTAVAMELAETAAADPLLAHYPELEARLCWIRGLFVGSSGRLQEALALYERASNHYRSLGERENTVFLQTLTAEAFDYVGATARAWRDRIASLNAALPARHPRRPHTMWVNAGIAAVRQGLPYVAVAMQNEAVRFTTVHGQPFLTFEAHLYRARARAAVGDATGARADLEVAEQHLPGVPVPLQPRMRTEVLVTRSLLPGADTASLARTAAGLFAEMGTNARVPLLLQRAAEARLADGDAAGALEDLERATAAAATLVPRAVENLRWAYADSLWPMFRAAALLHVTRADLDSALETAERGALRPDTPGGFVRSWRPPVDTVVVRLLLGRDGGAVILLTAGRKVAFPVPVGEAALERDVRQLRRLVLARDPRDDADQRLRALGQAWVDPWIDLVPEDAIVAVVPDGVLHHVPFQALRLADGRYLAERNPVTIWSRLADGGGRPAPMSGPGRSLVAVGLDRVPGADALGLAALARARDEVERIAPLYERAATFTDAAATPDAVVRALPGAGILHLATHAFANPEYGNLGWMALAPDDRHPRGLWFADEVRRLDLDHVALVYLSACDGSAGQLSRAEGAASLARAFLDAGADGVVASSWLLDDDLASELGEAFHRRYTVSGDIVRALNAAHRAMLADARWASRPLTWSAVQAFTRPPPSSSP